MSTAVLLSAMQKCGKAARRNIKQRSINTPHRIKKIKLFKSLFIGREDVYAKRFFNTKTGKSGYVPACANEWVTGVCDKKKYKCNSCPNKRFTAVNDRVIY